MGYLPGGISTHRPKFVKWLLPVMIDGRTLARRDTNPRQIRCLFTAVLSARATPRQRAPALTIASVPARDADVMALFRGHRRLLNPAPLREGLGPSYDALRQCVCIRLH